MKAILFALGVGAVAGAIDALPMLKKSPRFAVYLVFTQWLLLGLVIPFVAWEIPAWLKGLIMGVCGMVPIMCLVWPRNPKLIYGITVCGAVLGSAIGFIGEFIR